MNTKKTYLYFFENGERHHMTPVDAHKYSDRKKIKILKGPNYESGRKRKTFDGWGWHDSLQMSFRGPKHYREYLAQNGLQEWGDSEAPQYNEYSKPVWDEQLIRKAVNDYGLEIGSELAKGLLSGEIDFPEAP